MSKQTFELREDQDYITLNKLLQVLHIAQTGGHAKIMIQNEEVMVNEMVETKVRKKLVTSDKIKTGDHLIIIV